MKPLLVLIPLLAISCLADEHPICRFTVKVENTYESVINLDGGGTIVLTNGVECNIANSNRVTIYMQDCVTNGQAYPKITFTCYVWATGHVTGWWFVQEQHRVLYAGFQSGTFYSEQRCDDIARQVVLDVDNLYYPCPPEAPSTQPPDDH